MKIDSGNNNFSFKANIKISKQNIEKVCDAGLLTSAATTASGLGTLSVTPVSEPEHHIHILAKILDGTFAASGIGLGAYALKLYKKAADILFRSKKS